MKTLPLDANGLPVGHDAALHAATRELCEWVAELPDDFARLGQIDAECCMSRVIHRYLVTVQQQQRPVLEVVR